MDDDFSEGVMNTHDARVAAFAEDNRFAATVTDGYVESLVCAATSEVSDATLSLLGTGPLPRLHRLELWSTGISDEGLRFLSGFSQLRFLVLSDTALIGTGLSHLTCDSLEILRLSKCRGISEMGAPEIARFKNLKELWLDGTSVGDDALRSLGTLQSLVFLKLDDTYVTDVGMAHLTRLTNLKTIALRNTAVSECGYDRLRSQLPSLRGNLFL